MAFYDLFYLFIRFYEVLRIFLEGLECYWIGESLFWLELTINLCLEFDCPIFVGGWGIFE